MNTESNNPPQDPGEWVTEASFWLFDPLNGDLTKNRVVHFDDALALAHRCREAEKIAWIAKGEAADNVRNRNNLIDEIDALKAQLAAVQDETKDLREQKRHIQDQLATLSKINAKERLAVAEQLAAAQSKVAELEQERMKQHRINQ